MVVRETHEPLVAPVSVEEIRARLARLPRVHLALLPTPLHESPRLAAELGIGRLFIRRDDLTGLAFGGNKTRNLEFRLAGTVAVGADVIIAGPEARSNSARQTTVVASILGMKSVLILRQDRNWNWQGNSLIDRIFAFKDELLAAPDR